jgi:hypothetical protein
MEAILNLKNKWMKLGIVGVMVGMLAMASVAVYAQEAETTPPADAPAAGDPGFGGPRGQGGNGLFKIIVEQLGIEQAELRTALIEDGKTIAQLAEEKGVSTNTIVEAVVAARQEMLTAAVEAGNLTQAQADARLALVKADIEALLDKVFDGENMPGFGGGRGHDGQGNGGFGGRGHGGPGQGMGPGGNGGFGGWGGNNPPPPQPDGATAPDATAEPGV